MGDLNKKAVAEQTEGVGAWKSRQKVNKMFLARTIKNQMVTELMFEKQRKVKQLNTEAADEEKKSKKKRRKNSTSSSDSEIEVINENEKERTELTITSIGKRNYRLPIILYDRGYSMIWDFKGRRPLLAKDHVASIKDGP